MTAHPKFDRFRLQMRSLQYRPNKVQIVRDAISLDATPRPLTAASAAILVECAARIRAARAAGRPVILAFGAHTIKNGLAPVLIDLMRNGWITLLATNGAGIIHDWEFAFQGASSEDVRSNVDRGQFGIWEETGFYLNLALIVGAYEGLGYGEAVGKMIARDGLDIPERDQLLATARDRTAQDAETAAAAMDLLARLRDSICSQDFVPSRIPSKLTARKLLPLTLASHLPLIRCSGTTSFTRIRSTMERPLAARRCETFLLMPNRYTGWKGACICPLGLRSCRL